jgi:hypothetical protein
VVPSSTGEGCKRDQLPSSTAFYALPTRSGADDETLNDTSLQASNRLR